MTPEIRPHATHRGLGRQRFGPAGRFWQGFFGAGLAVGMALGLQAETLIPTGAQWRWRPGTNEASAPITAWRSPAFSDAQFVSARAPFWFGDALTGGTQISGMQNVYGSLFLRRAFVVPEISAVGGLRLGETVGPVISEGQYGTVRQYLEIAEEEGAVAAVGGTAAAGTSGLWPRAVAANTSISTRSRSIRLRTA